MSATERAITTCAWCNGCGGRLIWLYDQMRCQSIPVWILCGCCQ